MKNFKNEKSFIILSKMDLKQEFNIYKIMQIITMG